MAIVNAKNATSFKSEMTNKKITLVNFWAPWCNPCRMFAPVLEEYDAEGNNDVKIVKVNVDENVETASEFGIMSIPATVLFKNGVQVDKRTGFMPLVALKEFINQHK